MITTARRIAGAASLAALAGLVAQPVVAQIRTVDPSSAQAHSDLAPGSGQPETSTQPPPESD